MRTLTLIAAIAVLAFAGCGGDDEEPASGGSDATSTPAAASGGAGEKLTIAADASALKFDKAELEAKAGNVTITMDNPSDTPHNVIIDGGSNAKPGETVGKGEKSVASADLEAGEFTYYCGVGSHRAAGMEGKLTVQ